MLSMLDEVGRQEAELEDLECKCAALDWLLSIATATPRRVPRPLGAAGAEGCEGCEGCEGNFMATGATGTTGARFAQRDVYAHMPVGNAPRWFECAICVDIKFSASEAATQHSALHPPVCSACLGRVESCPFCRVWIGGDVARRVCLRLLGRRNALVLADPPLWPDSA